jgi:hypothetical protein
MSVPASPTTRTSVTPMHRDTKLGLALAILVMGFAAALCFPRTPGEQTDSLALQSAQELDSGIRLGQVKTYTHADRPQPRVPEVTEVASTHTDPIPTPADVIDAEVLPVATVPEPVAGSPTSEPVPVNPANFPPEVVAESEPPVVHHKTYIVKPNDTLSSIAKEQLGAAGRWSEIFSANRDKLPGPESLRPQMVLVIPIPEDDEVAPAVPAPSSIVAAPETPPASKAAPVLNSPNNATRARFSGQPSRIGSSNAPRLQ